MSCARSGVYKSNFTAQRDAYQALFTALSDYTRTNSTQPLLHGLFAFWYDTASSSEWMDGKGSADSTWPCGFTPRGKPALDVIRAAFERSEPDPGFWTTRMKVAIFGAGALLLAASGALCLRYGVCRKCCSRPDDADPLNVQGFDRLTNN